MRELPETGTDLLDGYSLEITAKDQPKLEQASRFLPAGAVVSITYLAGETDDARVAAAVRLRQLGLTPMPHISARRLPSANALHAFLGRLSREAQIDRAFVVAGDCERPQGPFDDALAVIREGRLADHGVRLVGIGGYPEGHPGIPGDRLWQAMVDKTACLAESGLACEIITQFGFDAEPIMAWLAILRARGIAAPVRIGVPGPANVATLLRFAARCGVGASTKVMARYGASLTRALAPAGPERLVSTISKTLTPARHGKVMVHLYPFGGVLKAAEWGAAHGSGAPASG